MLVTVVKSLGFLRVKSGFTFRVCQGGLRFDRVQGFLGYRGFLRQGYCLGLVTVVQGLGLLKVQSGFVLKVIQRFFAVWVLLRVSYGCVGFRVRVKVQSGFALWVVLGCLRLGRVQGFEGIEWFCVQGCLRLVGFRVFQGIEWFCVQIVFLPALLGKIGALTALLEISMLRVRFSK